MWPPMGPVPARRRRSLPELPGFFKFLRCQCRLIRRSPKHAELVRCQLTLWRITGEVGFDVLGSDKRVFVDECRSRRFVSSATYPQRKLKVVSCTESTIRTKHPNHQPVNLDLTQTSLTINRSFKFHLDMERGRSPPVNTPFDRNSHCSSLVSCASTRQMS